MKWHPIVVSLILYFMHSIWLTKWSNTSFARNEIYSNHRIEYQCFNDAMYSPPMIAVPSKPLIPSSKIQGKSWNYLLTTWCWTCSLEQHNGRSGGHIFKCSCVLYFRLHLYKRHLSVNGYQLHKQWSQRRMFFLYMDISSLFFPG